jgi:hypothetical protein
MTIEHILAPNPVVPRDAALVTAAAHKLNVPYRMTEGNTCYRGGKPGVSDTFASALWAADYLLQLASLGYAGVNLHGGDAQMVANSLGGTLPGDELVLAAHGNPATHPHPYYTPIAKIDGHYQLEPVAYGMKSVQAFLNDNPLVAAQMLPIEFNAGPVNATAYAAAIGEISPKIAIINKDPVTTLAVAIDFARFNVGMLGLKRLTAAGLRSTSMTFTADPSAPPLTGKLGHSGTMVDVPPASALIVEGIFVV